MKNILFLLITISLFATACSKHQEEEDTNSDRTDTYTTESTAPTTTAVTTTPKVTTTPLMTTTLPPASTTPIVTTTNVDKTVAPIDIQPPPAQAPQNADPQPQPPVYVETPQPPSYVEPPPPVNVEPEPQPNPQPLINPGSHQDSIAKEILILVNNERAAYGLDALGWDGNFEITAKIRANEIVSHFSSDHSRPDGRAWYTTLTDAGISYRTVGENIARGGSTSQGAEWYTAQMVMEGWMNSPGHRANILNSDFKYLGVGVVDADGMRYYVQHFGAYFN